jgi:MFS family permease
MGLAFSIDAVSFLFSLGALMMVRIRDDHGKVPTGRGVFAEIGEGLRAVWNDVQLRAFILYVAAGSLFVGGPLQVGLPVLANSRLSLGAASLGLLMTANGAGTLLGGILSGKGVRAVGGKVGLMVLCMDSVVGLLVAAMSQVHSTITGAALLVVTGAIAGIVQISIFTWLQRRVPPAMMGRTMSILMFTFMGLAPVSAALAGAALKFIPVGDLFVFAGFGLTGIALFCLTRPQLRGIEMTLPAVTAR